MTILIIGSVLFGGLLGKYFKCFVLIPVMIVIFAVIASRVAFYDHGLLWSAVEFVVVAAFLQLGYAVGLFASANIDMMPRNKTATYMTSSSLVPVEAQVPIRGE